MTTNQDFTETRPYNFHEGLILLHLPRYMLIFSLFSSLNNRITFLHGSAHDLLLYYSVFVFCFLNVPIVFSNKDRNTFETLFFVREHVSNDL